MTAIHLLPIPISMQVDYDYMWHLACSFVIIYTISCNVSKLLLYICRAPVLGLSIFACFMLCMSGDRCPFWHLAALYNIMQGTCLRFALHCALQATGAPFGCSIGGGMALCNHTQPPFLHLKEALFLPPKGSELSSPVDDC